MSLTRLTYALLVAVVAYLVSGSISRFWRANGRHFKLRVGRDLSTVSDESGHDVCVVRNVLYYSRGGDRSRFAGIGERPTDTGEYESSSLLELGALRAEDAHQRFAAFVLFCLARARRRAEVPVWRYATFDIELSKDYQPIVDIVQAAQGTRPLRNAVRSMSIAKA